MWLTLLLDKSTLQGLSNEELATLGRYYRLALPPVLLAETLGDLARVPESRWPVWMAEKVTRVFQHHVIIDWPALLEQDLLGHRVPMQGSIPIPMTREVVDPEGGAIQFSDEQPAAKALRRWRAGEFVEAERQAAQHWRALEKTLAPSEVLGAFRGILLPRRVRSTAELQAAVYGVTSNLRNQSLLLGAIERVFGLDNELIALVWRRWEAQRHRRFVAFAPYAAHCLRVALSTALAMDSGLIRASRRAKPGADMLYLFFLPFVRVFATSDHDQRLLSSIFVRRFQVFVDGSVLKADLSAIAAYLRALSPVERAQHFLEYGPYPPDISGSFTRGLTSDWFRPRPSQAGRAIQLEGEDLKRFTDLLRRRLDLLGLDEHE